MSKHKSRLTHIKESKRELTDKNKANKYYKQIYKIQLELSDIYSNK